MSKKYKGKTCAYCGGVGISETRDHVLVREFVLVRHRGHLPAVPACRPCNTRKSALESELVSLLPFGGRHRDAVEQLDTLVAPRLLRNDRLRERLRAAASNPEVAALGFPSDQTMLVNRDVIEEWVRLLTLGVIFHHFGVAVAGRTTLSVQLFAQEAEEVIAPFFQFKGRRVPRTSIGGEAVIYEGVAAPEGPLVSVWRYALFNGLQMAGDDPQHRARTFVVFVRPAKPTPAT